MRQLRCEICGGRLLSQSGGQCQCQGCGLEYSSQRLRELFEQLNAVDVAEVDVAEVDAAGADDVADVGVDVNAADIDGADDAEAPPQTELEAEISRLKQEQQVLLAQIRLADGLLGPSQRRELSSQLRKLERRLARLQGDKRFFFWF